MRSTWRSSPLAGDGGVDELVVGQAAPQEERQPRRELEVADAIERARRRARRIVLDAEQELRRHENVGERRLHAGLEIAALRALGAVEVEQPAALGVGDRPAIGAPREAREYPLGARGGLGLLRGLAREDALAARRAAGARDGQRAFDDELVELGNADVHARVVLLALERLQHVLTRRGALLRERDADVVLARLHDDARLEAAVDLVGRLAGEHLRRHFVRRAAEARQ
jgi:hypothetical protein